MSMCKMCLKDSSKHSTKLWTLHNWCPICQKNIKEHSDDLWQMHQQVVAKGAKGGKIRPITVGLARSSVGVVAKLNAKPPFNIEIVPIYMHCAKCSLAMGDIEVDNADVLDSLCLECFTELTEQINPLDDKFPNYRSYEHSQKIRKRIEERK